MTNFPRLCQELLPKDDLLDENEKELIQNVSLIEDSESDHAAGDDAAIQGTFLQSEDHKKGMTKQTSRALLPARQIFGR